MCYRRGLVPSNRRSALPHMFMTFWCIPIAVIQNQCLSTRVSLADDISMSVSNRQTHSRDIYVCRGAAHSWQTPNIIHLCGYGVHTGGHPHKDHVLTPKPRSPRGIIKTKFLKEDIRVVYFACERACRRGCVSTGLILSIVIH